MSIEAMKQALEALEELVLLFDRTRESGCLPMQLVRANAALKILRAAIAEASMQRLTDVQQEMEQEPVAWKVAGEVSNWSKDFSAYQTRTYVEPVYAHPPTREWVGLTDEDHEAFCIRSNLHPVIAQALAEYIEAKLKEKNT